MIKNKVNFKDTDGETKIGVVVDKIRDLVQVYDYIDDVHQVTRYHSVDFYLVMLPDSTIRKIRCSEILNLTFDKLE